MKLLLVINTVLCMVISALADVTLVEDENPLRSRNYNSNNAFIGNAPLLRFKITAGEHEVLVTNIIGVTGGITTEDPHPTTISLHSGTTQLGATTWTAPQFNIPTSIVIAPNMTTTLEVHGDFTLVPFGISRTVVQGIGFTENNIQRQLYTENIPGPEIRFLPTVANFSLADVPEVTSTYNLDGTTTSVVCTFKSVVNALASDTESDVKIDNVTLVGVSENGLDSVILPNAFFSLSPTGNIPDMSSATMTIIGEFPVELFTKSGSYRFFVQQINWSASDGSTVTEQYWGLDNFKTPYVAIQKAGVVQPQRFKLPTIGLNEWYNIGNYASGGELGIPGQIVSEGGILHVSTERTNTSAIVVFPVTSQTVAQFMKIEVEIGSSSITSKVLSPANPLQPIDGGGNSYVEWPISNLTTVDGVTYTFTVHIGNFTGYASVYKTGTKSCLVRMFWGEGATPFNPGPEMDMLDKSPSFGDAVKNYPPKPPRIKFGIKESSKNGSTFSIRADLLIGGFTVEQSTDLVSWSEVSTYNLQTIGTNGDGTSECVVNINTSEQRSFYRLVLNQ